MPREMAADRGPEDGMDPKDFFRREAGPRTGRKRLQLCEQVREALYWALGADAGDPALALYQVVGVDPLPNGNRLLVRVAAPPGVGRDEAADRLARAASTLRRRVAEAVTRRKVPELVFEAVP